MRKNIFRLFILPVLSLALTVGVTVGAAIKVSETKASSTNVSITDVHVRGNNKDDMYVLVRLNDTDYPTTEQEKSLSSVVSATGANFLDKTKFYFADDKEAKLSDLLANDIISFRKWGENNAFIIKINISEYAQAGDVSKIIFEQDCSFPCYSSSNNYTLTNKTSATYSHAVIEFLYLYSIKQIKDLNTTVSEVHIRGTSATNMYILIRLAKNDYPVSETQKTLSTLVANTGANFLDNVYFDFNDNTSDKLRNLVAEDKIIFCKWGEANSFIVKINIAGHSEAGAIENVVFLPGCSFPCFETNDAYFIQNRTNAKYNAKVIDFLYTYVIGNISNNESVINDVHVRGNNKNDLYLLVRLTESDYPSDNISKELDTTINLTDATFLDKTYLYFSDSTSSVLKNLVSNNFIEFHKWGEDNALTVKIDIADHSKNGEVTKIVFEDGCSFPSYSSITNYYVQPNYLATYSHCLTDFLNLYTITTKTDINKIDSTNVVSGSIKNNLLTFTLANSNYDVAGENATVKKEKLLEANFLYKIKIETDNYAKFLIDLVDESKDYYYNYEGVANSFSVPLIISSNEIISVQINKDIQFPSATYTGFNTTLGSDCFFTYFEVSENKMKNDSGILLAYGQINEKVLIDYIRLGDTNGDSTHFYIKLINSDYPTETIANIEVHQRCLEYKTYDYIMVDGKTLTQYMNEKKITDYGAINRWTRWQTFAFSIEGMTSSNVESHQVKVLSGCKFPAYDSNKYFVFEGDLETTSVAGSYIYKSKCNLGTVKLTAGDPNGDITERFFIKMSKSDYDSSSKITGTELTNIINAITIDTTSCKQSHINSIYANGMGRSDTIAIDFSFEDDMKDNNHTIKISKTIKLPAMSDKLTNYVDYAFSIDRDYEFGNYLRISNGQWFDVSKVKIFVTDYMHMNDYNENLGYCNDKEHHYYKTAKAEFLTFSEYEIAYLISDYPEAFARLTEWAKFNNEMIENNDFVTLPTSEYTIIKANNNTILIIAVGALLSLTECVIFYTIRRRRSK